MRLRSMLFVCGAALLSVSPVGATILTFDQDPPVGNNEPVNQAYGDGVTSTLHAVNLQYGVGSEGFTPAIQTTYFPTTANPFGEPRLWRTGYGDLTNVLFEGTNAPPPLLQVSLPAFPGFVTQLYGFDMAALLAPGPDPTINYVRVLDSLGIERFRANNPTISKSTHTSFDFSAAPLTDNVLVIEIDSNNLGSQAHEVALDNIRFGQLAGDGLSQNTPFVPGPPGPGQNGWRFGGVPGTGAWFDPVAADGYDFLAEGGAKFVTVQMPTIVPDNNNSFIVNEDGGSFSVAPGGTYTFTVPQDSFSITDILPSVNGDDPSAFPVHLLFDQTTVSFTMTPIPEPGSISLLGLGLALTATLRRRHEYKRLAA